MKFGNSHSSFLGATPARLSCLFLLFSFHTLSLLSTSISGLKQGESLWRTLSRSIPKTVNENSTVFLPMNGQLANSKKGNVSLSSDVDYESDATDIPDEAPSFNVTLGDEVDMVNKTKLLIPFHSNITLIQVIKTATTNDEYSPPPSASKNLSFSYEVSKNTGVGAATPKPETAINSLLAAKAEAIMPDVDPIDHHRQGITDDKASKHGKAYSVSKGVASHLVKNQFGRASVSKSGQVVLLGSAAGISPPTPVDEMINTAAENLLKTNVQAAAAAAQQLENNRKSSDQQKLTAIMESTLTNVNGAIPTLSQVGTAKLVTREIESSSGGVAADKKMPMPVLPAVASRQINGKHSEPRVTMKIGPTITKIASAARPACIPVPLPPNPSCNLAPVYRGDCIVNYQCTNRKIHFARPPKAPSAEIILKPSEFPPSPSISVVLSSGASVAKSAAIGITPNQPPPPPPPPPAPVGPIQLPKLVDSRMVLQSKSPILVALNPPMRISSMPTAVSQQQLLTKSIMPTPMKFAAPPVLRRPSVTPRRIPIPIRKQQPAVVTLNRPIRYSQPTAVVQQRRAVILSIPCPPPPMKPDNSKGCQDWTPIVDEKRCLIDWDCVERRGKRCPEAPEKPDRKIAPNCNWIPMMDENNCILDYQCEPKKDPGCKSIAISPDDTAACKWVPVKRSNGCVKSYECEPQSIARPVIRLRPRRPPQAAPAMLIPKLPIIVRRNQPRILLKTPFVPLQRRRKLPIFRRMRPQRKDVWKNRCCYWASQRRCFTHAAYMNHYCPKSCSVNGCGKGNGYFMGRTCQEQLIQSSCAPLIKRLKS